MFPIITVEAEADQLEPMGSKPKFWFDHPDHGRCLFKAARPHSGEDWSEKVAEELAGGIGLPHAKYHLAEFRGERGIVTPRMTRDDERLVHGNEILIELDPVYEAGSTQYRTPLHTVGAVLDALSTRGVAMPSGWTPPEGVSSSGDAFLGYLMLDALIGNTDRHHENWGAIESLGENDEEAVLALAPTFDHASSLGRNEPLDRMAERLATRDHGFTVEAYAARAHSALFSDPADSKPLTPHDAFELGAVMHPEAARAWCNRLQVFQDAALKTMLMEVPEERMHPDAKEFALRMLIFNRDRLEELCQSA